MVIIPKFKLVPQRKARTYRSLLRTLNSEFWEISDSTNHSLFNDGSFPKARCQELVIWKFVVFFGLRTKFPYFLRLRRPHSSSCSSILGTEPTNGDWTSGAGVVAPYYCSLTTQQRRVPLLIHQLALLPTTLVQNQPSH